ncbi:hypothetical protein GCM10008908_09300 [Clostridium subterminale]|uniref:Uncharacterized protein n=1 Tax=Clostridium subterminale TaxID=1550 RepID=A0ABP3VXA9_CLOSU
MYECKNLDEAIWFRLNDLELEVVNENGRVMFLCNENQENFNDVIMEYLSAKSGFRDITCNYTKLLESTRWVKNKLYENK